MSKQMRPSAVWALLCLLAFGLRSKSAVEHNQGGGWGTSLSSTPNAYTTEGQLAMGWAFIDGVQSRRSTGLLVALWTLRLGALVFIAGLLYTLISPLL